MYRQNYHILYKETSVYTMDTTNVNSYKFNLSITDTLGTNVDNL